jgi:hypothetical protein
MISTNSKNILILLCSTGIGWVADAFLQQKTSFIAHKSCRKTIDFMATETGGTLSSDSNLLKEEKLAELLDVAVSASKKAGSIIKEHAYGAQIEKSKANSRDLLTLIDPLCEKVRKLHQAHR